MTNQLAPLRSLSPEAKLLLRFGGKGQSEASLRQGGEGVSPLATSSAERPPHPASPSGFAEASPPLGGGLSREGRGDRAQRGIIEPITVKESLVEVCDSAKGRRRVGRAAVTGYPEDHNYDYDRQPPTPASIRCIAQRAFLRTSGSASSRTGAK